MKDIYWLAGLLEGDGCFTVALGRYPTIKVDMYDRDIVQRVRSILKPRTSRRLSFHQRKDRKQPIYETTLTGDKAIGWMMTLYPLMGQRRQARIKELITQWRGGHKTRGGIAA